MGSVITFEKSRPRPAAQNRGRPSELDQYLLALSHNVQAIGVNGASIRRDLQVIEDIRSNSEDPELSGRLLQQMKAIKYQLQLIALALVDARRSIPSPSR